MATSTIAIARVFLVLALCVASVHFTGAANCNEVCANNQQCTNPGCSRCQINDGSTTGLCVAGYSCGHNCTQDTDCNFVTGGCDQCVNNTCVTRYNGCGSFCSQNSDCGDPICSRCFDNGGTRLCSPGNPCGGACTIDSDCNQFGNNCTSCMNGKCFGACGQPCNQDSQCDPSSCSLCADYACRAVPPTPTISAFTRLNSHAKPDDINNNSNKNKKGPISGRIRINDNRNDQ